MVTLTKQQKTREKIKEKCKLKIAQVLPPITLSSSALAYRKEFSPIYIWLSKHYEIKPFINSKRRMLWIEPWKVYIHGDGILWLLRLPFALIKGNFHLFIAATGPEGIIAFIISKLLRRPILIMDSHWFWAKSLLAHLAWPIRSFLPSHATAFCVVSKRAMKFWKKAGISEEKMKVIHFYVSMVDVKERHITLVKELKEKLGLRNKKIILYFGRLIKRKGIDYLIRAFARISNEIKDVNLVIVGDGPERDNLKELCSDMKLKNVLFTGFISEKDKPAYFLLSDILVCPSITTDLPEEWGLVVNEGMSVGTPVIVTKAVGCAYELVKSGVNGYVVPEKDLEALYIAIKNLIDFNSLRTKMGKMSMKTILEEFNYYNLYKGVREVIEQVAIEKYTRCGN